MPRSPQLKVFRTPIGFHDAYVAAPSQKAALEAWGSDRNLFSSSAAERVDDPELMREALATPGIVVRRLRGTAAEHIAALPKEAPAARGRAHDARASESGSAASAPRAARPSKPKPRPDRAALKSAEDELNSAEARHEEERAALASRQAALDRDRRRLEVDHACERDLLVRRVETVRRRYDRAMEKWRDD